MNDNFRTVAITLAPYADGAQSLIDMTDAVLDVLPSLTSGHDNHEGRVRAVLRTGVIMDHVKAGKKIQAIKEVRALTGCGLADAKNAVEDWRIWGTYAPEPPKECF